MVRTAPQVAATKEALHRVQSQSQSAAAAENRAQGALEKAKVELRQAQADAALRTVQQQAERTAAEPTGRRGPVSDPNPNPNPNPSPNPNPNPNPLTRTLTLGTLRAECAAARAAHASDLKQWRAEVSQP